MKKIIASISFLCYLVVSSGIIINSQYCMKKLVSTRIFQTNAKICGRCGMDNTHKSNGCCHDEVKFVKLVQDQNTITIDSYSIPAIEQLVIISSHFITASFQNTNEQRHFHNHSPPLLSAQDIYLRNNVFRI